jgi:hypothetical protein
MKSIILFLLIVISVFCQSANTSSIEKNDEIVILEKKLNQKYGVEALFYGENLIYGEKQDLMAKIIKFVVFRDTNNGAEIKYLVSDETKQAVNFYFLDVWSPDEEYLVMPISKFEGFAIFNAKDVLNDIKSKKYFDTIKTKGVNSGWFWHDFEKWENNSTLSFRAGLEGDMFAFKYDVINKELGCYQTKCNELDIGKNLYGDIIPLKKGDIKATKIN